MIPGFRSYKQLVHALTPAIRDFHARAQTSPQDKREYADHVLRLAQWYAYAYYLAVVEKFVPDRNAVILDWGAQFGHVSALFQQRYPRTICYVADQDESLEYWQRLFKTTNVVLKKADDPMGIISMPTASVDAALSSGVLEHTREFGGTETESLHELRRVIKPGGYLAIFHLPTKYGFPEILNAALGRWHHEFRYTDREIRALLQDAGFEIVAMDKHEFLYPALRHALGQLIGQANAFSLDYAFSKLPAINFLAQHFTIMARNPA